MWALGIGAFAIGTGEFVIMGLLAVAAADIGATIPQAGHVISAYALRFVVGMPHGTYFGVGALLALAGLGVFAWALADATAHPAAGTRLQKRGRCASRRKRVAAPAR